MVRAGEAARFDRSAEGLPFFTDPSLLLLARLAVDHDVLRR